MFHFLPQPEFFKDRIHRRLPIFHIPKSPTFLKTRIPKRPKKCGNSYWNFWGFLKFFVRKNLLKSRKIFLSAKGNCYCELIKSSYASPVLSWRSKSSSVFVMCLRFFWQSLWTVCEIAKQKGKYLLREFSLQRTKFCRHIDIFEQVPLQKLLRKRLSNNSHSNFYSWCYIIGRCASISNEWL